MPLFAIPDIVLQEDGTGGLLLQSAEPLREYPVTVVHSVREWAAAGPDHPLVAERAPAGVPGSPRGWRTVTYGEAVTAADAIGQALLDLGLSPGRPLLILSGNSVDHLLLTLGAMTAGIPVAPGSVAYSRQSRDHNRIGDVRELITPGAVYAEDSEAFGPALDSLMSRSDELGPLPVIVSRGDRPGALRMADLLNVTPGEAIRNAFAAVTGEHVAKILFTSGSTGSPKGVLNTHRMLAANQQMIRQAWPFLERERPVIVDWLPWSHTFGGNHNVNMMLTVGGTLYIDGGRPAPGLFTQSVRNLADVPPTIYFNVPAGYAQLAPVLENDPVFARRFFSRLRLIFNAAAALPGALRDRLTALAGVYAPDRAIAITASWGATETAPAVLTANFEFTDARCIGAPLPGLRVRLVPSSGTNGGPSGSSAGSGTYEIRVQGPNVTPGYLARTDLTEAAFDEQGFYKSGDAVSFADPANPGAGLLFRGRIAEDFKLTTGTFVRVGAARAALLSAVPLLSDAVIAGENRGFVTALAWLNHAEASRLIGADFASGEFVPGDTVPGDTVPGDAELVIHDELHDHIGELLASHNAAAGSAGRVERLLVMARPADLDAGEITDKGYVN
ncbi:MAG: AMP-binding protein, partial [Trebonia sp.]